jgi:hypothetical protein
MLVRGLTQEQLEEAVNQANEKYDGNIRLYELRPENKRGDAFGFQVKVNDSHKAGSRVSPERYDPWQGELISKPRRIASACWHMHRDLYREIFKINPEARIRTALAYYKGSEDFEWSFYSTGDTNIGTAYAPVAIADACNCREGEYSDMANNLERA